LLCHTQVSFQMHVQRTWEQADGMPEFGAQTTEHMAHTGQQTVNSEFKDMASLNEKLTTPVSEEPAFCLSERRTEANVCS
jgi:hypothetical protein